MRKEVEFNKSAKKIRIPRRMKEIPDYAFKDFSNLEEIIIPNSVYKIGEGAFMNCTSLKKIRLPKKLNILGDYIFKNCTSLEEINIPPLVHNIMPYMFCNCINLKNIEIHDNIEYIKRNAFQNCKSLKDIEFPENIIEINEEAFLGCESVNSIHIPKNVNVISPGAFGLMSSLKKITVHEDNNYFKSYGNSTLLVRGERDIVQYAVNNKYKQVYLLKNNYNIADENSIGCALTFLDSIDDYAFAGAKNLEKMCISSRAGLIGKNAFLGCDNLKDLKITDYPCIFICPAMDKEIPFKNIEIDEGIKDLFPNIRILFKNAENIKLPDSIEYIHGDIFSDSVKLKEIKIPFNLMQLDSHNFKKNINIIFDKICTVNSNDFNNLSHYGNIKTLSFKNGNYYIVIDKDNIIKTSKNDILNLTNREFFAKDPNRFMHYLIELLKVNMNEKTKLDSICNNPDLKKLFRLSREVYHEQIKNNNFKKIVSNFLVIKNNSDEFIFNPLMFSENSNRKNIIEHLIKNFNTSLYRFSKFVSFNNNNSLNDILLLTDYCNLLEKYKQYDNFLYNVKIYLSLSLEDQELLIKHFNKNLKKLFIKSNVLNSSHYVNLKDFIKMCKALGVFSDNERLSQKITTFINEKLMDENKSFYLTDNIIHSIFDGINPRDELDYEFIEFFIENYKKIFELEKDHSGIISRMYNEFRNISDTSSSNRGNGHHLKVTVDKCLEYFALKMFDGVNKNNIELALLLRKYYSDNDILKIAEKIVEESKIAPRNIFTKDNDPCNDLKEDISDNYSYEWLPKQDYNNLILGKYCNCCAHINGVGRGIMRASMILDNCQNLVVRDENENIIAKATLYVNKDKGYAVFNTIEVSLSHHNKEEKIKIYKAILRGTKAFLEKYNENNKDNIIKTISVGTNRNSIEDILNNSDHPIITPNKAINFGNYSLDGKGYSGDWHNQRLILKI